MRIWPAVVVALDCLKQVNFPGLSRQPLPTIKTPPETTTMITQEANTLPGAGAAAKPAIAPRSSHDGMRLVRHFAAR